MIIHHSQTFLHKVKSCVTDITISAMTARVARLLNISTAA